MNRFRKNSLIIFISFVSITTPCQLHAISIKQLAELYASTLFFFLIGQSRIEEEIRLATKPVNHTVEQFIRAECKRIGLPEWQTVRIVQHPHKSMSTIDTLCLEKYLVDHIIQTGDQTHMAKAVIHHEAGHIKHRHILANAALSPLLSIASTYGALALLNRIYPQKESSLTLCALDLALFFYIIKPFFSRICEWDADFCIANDPYVLAGGIRYFSMIKDREDHYYHSLENISTLKHWYHECELFSTHPTTAKRIKRLQHLLAQHPNKNLIPHHELTYLLNPHLAVNT